MIVKKREEKSTLFHLNRCIADTNFFLLRDHAKVVKDTRAVMRCPLRCCKAVIPCLPLINGDFRFQRVHPEDKVPLPDAKSMRLLSKQ